MAGSKKLVAAKTCMESAQELGARPPAAAGVRATQAEGDSGREVARLVRSVVESEVIPRLLLARRARSRQPDPAADAWTPEAAHVAELAGLVLAREAGGASAYVEALRARGTPVEALYLGLLAPTARRLGELWKADLCGFTEVTVGLCRLQQVLRELSPAFQDEGEPRQVEGRRALLAPVPGEQHTFGLSMVLEFFRRAGWDVWGGSSATAGDLVRAVRGEWFAVVGLSLSSVRRLDATAAHIRAIRRASRNRAVGVLVGGPVFVAPGLVALVGADATAVDGRQATLQAENLLALLPSRRG
jgi:MerR family transcriptional regulator, light-induced transcriptional regulator